ASGRRERQRRRRSRPRGGSTAWPLSPGGRRGAGERFPWYLRGLPGTRFAAGPSGMGAQEALLGASFFFERVFRAGAVGSPRFERADLECQDALALDELFDEVLE